MQHNAAKFATPHTNYLTIFDRFLEIFLPSLKKATLLNTFWPAWFVTSFFHSFSPLACVQEGQSSASIPELSDVPWHWWVAAG